MRRSKIKNHILTRFDERDLDEDGVYEIPDKVTKIGEEAFRGCRNLTEVIIPEGVTEIGSWLFDGCSSLTNVAIPKSVTRIGPSAFEGCSSLTNIAIPDGVTEIGGFAFKDCSSLTEIAIPEGVTVIGYSAFEGCTSLESITISQSLTTIQERVFSGCDALKTLIVELEDGRTQEVLVEEITRAYGVEKFEELSITKDVLRNIKEYAKQKAERIASENLVEGKKVFSKINGSVFEKFDERDLDKNGHFTIPEKIEIIKERSFGYQKEMKSITIPESVKKIEKNAFRYSNLTSIKIPKNVKEIGPYAISDCSNLETIEVDEENENYKSEGNCLLSKDGKTLYSGCKNSIIPDTVEKLEENAFSGVGHMETLNLPLGLTEIGPYAFWDSARIGKYVVDKLIVEYEKGKTQEVAISDIAKELGTNASSQYDESQLNKIRDLAKEKAKSSEKDVEESKSSTLDATPTEEKVEEKSTEKTPEEKTIEEKTPEEKTEEKDDEKETSPSNDVFDAVYANMESILNELEKIHPQDKSETSTEETTIEETPTEEVPAEEISTEEHKESDSKEVSPKNKSRSKGKSSSTEKASKSDDEIEKDVEEEHINKITNIDMLNAELEVAEAKVRLAEAELARAELKKKILDAMAQSVEHGASIYEYEKERGGSSSKTKDERMC